MCGAVQYGLVQVKFFEAEGETDVDLPNLRIFRSAREHWHEPLQENRDRLARWKPCNPESAAETSAVAYYFSKTLQQKLEFLSE